MKAGYHREKGKVMPQSAEDAVAVVEQRRIDALIASDINVLDEIIDEHCTHIESKVAYLLAADKYSRSLASRLMGVNQPVIRTRNGFSTLHPTQLVCI